MWYNNELACGKATTQDQPSRPGGYQPVKINNQMTFRLSGLNPPMNPDGSTRRLLFGQVWTLDPDLGVAERQTRNDEYRRGLDVNCKM